MNQPPPMPHHGPPVPAVRRPSSVPLVVLVLLLAAAVGAGAAWFLRSTGAGGSAENLAAADAAHSCHSLDRLPQTVDDTSMGSSVTDPNYRLLSAAGSLAVAAWLQDDAYEQLGVAAGELLTQLHALDTVDYAAPVEQMRTECARLGL